ncbi:hypothetical protein [Chitinophaga defluvii]|uniref:Uncharacterized protein n=1 Tax=Chitinophaga defluvii TaxID=3163343 RepID=A0ABV2T8M8_9BACT
MKKGMNSKEKAFTERMKGRQPVIEIHGHPFFIEARWGLLTPKGNFLSKGINLNDMCEFSPGTYRFYYDTNRMTEAVIRKDIIELPKNVVLIEIPSLLALDPVMMAKRWDEDPRRYLNEYPLKMYNVAKVIPIKKSPLVELVKKNLEKIKALQSPRQRIIKSSSPDRKKKGKGL